MYHVENNKNKIFTGNITALNSQLTLLLWIKAIKSDRGGLQPLIDEKNTKLYNLDV